MCDRQGAFEKAHDPPFPAVEEGLQQINIHWYVAAGETLFAVPTLIGTEYSTSYITAIPAARHALLGLRHSPSGWGELWDRQVSSHMSEVGHIDITPGMLPRC